MASSGPQILSELTLKLEFQLAWASCYKNHRVLMSLEPILGCQCAFKYVFTLRSQLFVMGKLPVLRGQPHQGSLQGSRPLKRRPLDNGSVTEDLKSEVKACHYPPENSQEV